MGMLSVDTVGLRMLAAHCESWAGEVSATRQPLSAGPTWQATSSAVTVLEASADTAARRTADQLRSTAATLTVTSTAYDVTDEDEAALLAAPVTQA
jgi:hypothetical protein